MVTGSVSVDIQEVNREKEGRHCHERGGASMSYYWLVDFFFKPLPTERREWFKKKILPANSRT